MARPGPVAYDSAMTGSDLQDRRRSLAAWSRPGERLWLIAAFLTPVLVYLPAALAEYGFSESYRLLAFYYRGPSIRHLMLAEGRPGFAVWAGLAFGLLSGSIRALSAVRFLNICTIGLTAALVAMILRRAGLRDMDAMLGGIASMMLPSFQLFAATAAMGGAVVAAVLASIAALRTRSVAGNGGALSLIEPAAWLVAAQATYQPAAMMFFAFAAVLLLLPDFDRADLRRMLRKFTIVGVTAAVIEFALFLVGRHLFPEELIGAPRAQLSLDPLAKLAWFFGLPMAHATNLWVLRPNLLAGVVLAIAISAGLSLTVRAREDRWLSMAVAFMLVPISYLPNLAVVENHSSFRSQPALAALFLFFYILILHAALRSRRGLLTIVMAAFTVFACVTARSNVMSYIVRPQVRELQLVRNTLRALPDDYRTIGIRKAVFTDTFAPAVFADEFGYPSTALPWSFAELTWLVLREQAESTGREIPVLVDVLGSANRDAPIVPATVRPDTIIDWGEVLRAERDRPTMLARLMDAPRERMPRPPPAESEKRPWP